MTAGSGEAFFVDSGTASLEELAKVTLEIRLQDNRCSAKWGVVVSDLSQPRYQEPNHVVLQTRRGLLILMMQNWCTRFLSELAFDNGTLSDVLGCRFD